VAEAQITSPGSYRLGRANSTESIGARLIGFRH